MFKRFKTLQAFPAMKYSAKGVAPRHKWMDKTSVPKLFQQEEIR